MRSQRLLSVLLVTASTLVFAPAAGTAPAPPATCGPGDDCRDARRRRPLLPAVRQRRVRRAALRPRDPVRAPHEPPPRGGDDHGPDHAEPELLQPGSGGPDRARDHRERRPGDVVADPSRADDHARRTARLRRGPLRHGELRRVPEGVRHPEPGRRVRVHPDPRRGDRRGGTRGGDRVVPGQRPSQRPRLVHLPDHGAERLRRGRQRGARVEDDERELDDPRLAGARPDGQLPRDVRRGRMEDAVPRRRRAACP